MAKASGKAASRPSPPKISQVSLPSQTGAIEFITVARAASPRTSPYSMPTPRSKPSKTT